MHWHSRIIEHGPIALPPFSATRILMMPFDLADVSASLPPSLKAWIPLLVSMRECSLVRDGIAYVTIDEREVPTGVSHRRPGLHVDGWRDDIGAGIWGGATWGGGAGMFVATNRLGSRAWDQAFHGEPSQFGDCEHLRAQCLDDAERPLWPNRVYWLGSLTVHESLPVDKPMRRQFIRLSLPSRGAWPISCTPNPLGVQPPHGTCQARPAAFTNYVTTDVPGLAGAGP